MGLDAYFYVDHDQVGREKIIAEYNEADATGVIETLKQMFTSGDDKSKELVYLFKQLFGHYGDEAKNKLASEMSLILSKEGISTDPSIDGMEEVGYFRKFWFLNYYFDYGDEWYGRNKRISKQQIEDLKSKCEEALSRLSKLQKSNVSRRGDMLKDENEEIDLFLCRSFPSRGNLVFRSDINELSCLCDKLMNCVDWDKEAVYYNADW